MMKVVNDAYFFVVASEKVSKISQKTNENGNGNNYRLGTGRKQDTLKWLFFPH